MESFSHFRNEFAKTGLGQRNSPPCNLPASCITTPNFSPDMNAGIHDHHDSLSVEIS
jgi:hypothetical protein